MTNGRSFTFPGLTGKRNQPSDAFLAILELLPSAAVLIDEHSGLIGGANTQFCKLASLPATELVGRAVAGLIPGWQEGAAPIRTVSSNAAGGPGGTAVQERPSTHPDTFPLAKVTSLPAEPKGKRLLMVHVPAHDSRELFSEESLFKFWGSLSRLMAAIQQAELGLAVHAALEAARELTGADTLAIYRLQSGHPVLMRCFETGEKDVLPGELAAQELSTLSRPRAWDAGKRPTCSLQRHARTAYMAYLLSAPIGEERATIGLAVIGGQRMPETGLNRAHETVPAKMSLPIVQLLATVITAIFQQNTRFENQALRMEAQEQRTRLVTSIETHAHEGVIVLDPNLRVVRLNPAARMMMGYPGEEVAGQMVDKVLIGPEALVTALHAALKGSATYQMNNVRLYRRNGEAFLALMRVYPVVHDGQVEHVLVLLQDLSEQEQIRMQTQQLEQRALLGEVTAVFAHEVRNPINNISTGLQVMGMNLQADDPNQAAIARMLQDCDRLAELMRSVLAFAKPADYEMEPLQVGALINRLLERQHPRILKQNMQYSLRIEEDCPNIQGNPRALEQVFTNLIGNALQAMNAAGGHLIIKACLVSEDGHRFVEVSVADTGPGIPREPQERVFQPFFTTEKGGTGLGLAIVKRIITAHKGNITLTIFPGGTIFRVRLPAIDKG